MIVVSIDPMTKQVAMFSLPRDTVDIPLPPGPPRNASAASTRGKINALFTAAATGRPRRRATSRTRGYNGAEGDPRQPLRARHQVLRRGQLRRLQAGRRRARRRDDQRPGPGHRRQLPGRRRAASPRVYIPAGIQHMTGAEALVYARSRHASDDFDRAARQQRVLLSLREQADIAQT